MIYCWLVFGVYFVLIEKTFETMEPSPLSPPLRCLLSSTSALSWFIFNYWTTATFGFSKCLSSKWYGQFSWNTVLTRMRIPFECTWMININEGVCSLLIQRCLAECFKSLIYFNYWLAVWLSFLSSPRYWCRDMLHVRYLFDVTSAIWLYV